MYKEELKKLILFGLIVLTLMLSFIPSAFAVPGTSDDVPESTPKQGWVDLSASVPEGFNGSVSVHLTNTADYSSYTVECFILGDFKNSAQLPLGNYVVDAASTSKDRFQYEAFCDIDEFELTNSVALHVTVTENSMGAAFLAGEIEDVHSKGIVKPSASETKKETKASSAPNKSGATETTAAPDADKAQPEPTHEADDEPEQTAGRSLWSELLISVIIFFAGVFFIIYYISRQRYR